MSFADHQDWIRDAEGIESFDLPSAEEPPDEGSITDESFSDLE